MWFPEENREGDQLGGDQKFKRPKIMSILSGCVVVEIVSTNEGCKDDIDLSDQIHCKRDKSTRLLGVVTA